MIASRPSPMIRVSVRSIHSACSAIEAFGAVVAPGWKVLMLWERFSVSAFTTSTSPPFSFTTCASAFSKLVLPTRCRPIAARIVGCPGSVGTSEPPTRRISSFPMQVPCRIAAPSARPSRQLPRPARKF